MSLLSICQDAARELSIAVPANVSSATTNRDAVLLFRLAKKEGFLLSRRAFWSALRKEHTFSTVAADSQGTASMPSDFSCFVEETIYDRTSRRPWLGPITPQEWQQYKTNLIVPSDPHYIQRGATLLVSPLQATGHSVYYEYISKNWARSNAGAEQSTFLNDSDTHVFADDQILTQGIIWRWRKHKSMAFEDEREDYERMVTDQIMRDGGKARINLNARIGVIRRGKSQMQDYNTIPQP